LQTQVSEAIQASDPQSNLQEISASIQALAKMPPKSMGPKVVKIVDQLQNTFNQLPNEQALNDLLNQAFELESALKHP
jgi:hypothetical protein